MTYYIRGTLLPKGHDNVEAGFRVHEKIPYSRCKEDTFLFRR